MKRVCRFNCGGHTQFQIDTDTLIRLHLPPVLILVSIPHKKYHPIILLELVKLIPSGKYIFTKVLSSIKIFMVKPYHVCLSSSPTYLLWLRRSTTKGPKPAQSQSESDSKATLKQIHKNPEKVSYRISITALWYVLRSRTSNLNHKGPKISHCRR